MAFFAYALKPLFNVNSQAHLSVGADSTREFESDFQSFRVPADGTGAATVGSGDFGTFPFFGSFSGKPHQPAYAYQNGVRHAQHNKGFREWLHV
jgi:hypothetical protein